MSSFTSYYECTRQRPMIIDHRAVVLLLSLLDRARVQRRVRMHVLRSRPEPTTGVSCIVPAVGKAESLVHRGLQIAAVWSGGGLDTALRAVVEDVHVPVLNRTLNLVIGHSYPLVWPTYYAECSVNATAPHDFSTTGCVPPA